MTSNALQRSHVFRPWHSLLMCDMLLLPGAPARTRIEDLGAWTLKRAFSPILLCCYNDVNAGGL